MGIRGKSLSDKEITVSAELVTAAHQLLQTLPGIQETEAATILAESGPDRKEFPDAADFSSWSGLAPGNNESTGKRRRAPALKGNPHNENRRRRVRLVSHAHQRSRVRAPIACTHLLAVRICEILTA